MEGTPKSPMGSQGGPQIEGDPQNPIWDHEGCPKSEGTPNPPWDPKVGPKIGGVTPNPPMGSVRWTPKRWDDPKIPHGIREVDPKLVG